MPTILLEVDIDATQIFDGITFRSADAFRYRRVDNNHYVADATVFAPGDVGVFDLRDMLAEIEATVNRGVVDLASVEAQSRQRVTDLVIERGLILSTAAQQLPALGVTSPDLPGFSDGINDQFTPNVIPSQGNATDLFRFGGSGFTWTTSTLLGGVVTVPTDYRIFVRTAGDTPPRRLLLWAIVNYSCECWGEWGRENSQGD